MTVADVPSDGDRAAAADRAALRLAVAAGLLVAAAGATWILTIFERRPRFDCAYHVPLAFVVVAGAVDAWLRRGRIPVRGFLLATLLAGAYTVGRVREDWFASGHTTLGVLFALAAPRPAWRALGLAVAVQAAATKWVMHERPESALYGAALGAFIGLVARRNDRARPAPTTPS